LEGLNQRFEGFYNRYSKLYRPLSVMATFLLGGEGKVRRDLMGPLPKNAGRFLEVSIGSGRNLPFLLNVLKPQEMYGIDISGAQLDVCAASARIRGWDLELAEAKAEALPYADDTFDAVLHVGGINFFSDPAGALREMVRVAKPGAPILVADETERAARIFDWIVPGFSSVFDGKRKPIVPPDHLLPANVSCAGTEIIWRGMAYRIQFRKQAASEGAKVF
jgi:ubiquinone/menaquinone biosynthesis C-methylase UbiE